MSLNSTSFKIQYSGNGSSTVFSFPYLFIDNSHLVITETVTATGVDTLKTITTHYTVTGAGVAAGGSVTMLTAPATGVRLTIERTVPITQITDYQTNDNFPAETHESALDKLTMVSQQIASTGGSVDRSLKFPATEAAGFVSTLGSAVARASSFLGFDANGALNYLTLADIGDTTIIGHGLSQSGSTLMANIPLWLTNTAYVVGSVIRYTDEKIYRCDTAHTSGTFATDLAAVKWVELSGAALTQSQIYDTPQYAATSGTDTYTATLSPVPTAYVTGMLVTLKFGNANTGAATINLNSLGAKAIQFNGAALASGDLPANSTADLVYDGTNFQLTGVVKAPSASIAHIDWAAYTPTVAGGFGTATSISARWRKVGSSLECSGEFETGTVSAAVGTITIPGGYTIVNNGAQQVGICSQAVQLPDALTYNDGTSVKTNINANSYHGSTQQQQFRFTCEVS